MSSVVLITVIMLSVKLDDIMLSVVMLNDIVLGVVAPTEAAIYQHLKRQSSTIISVCTLLLSSATNKLILFVQTEV